MKKVIIFYEIITREYLACNKIRKILEEKYNFCVGLYSIEYEYFKALKFAKKNGIDCIVMPWFKRENDYKKMYPFIKLNKDIVICDLAHEQIASDETKITVIPSTEETKNKCYHFCWGEYFKNLLLKNGVNDSNLHITGNSRLDFKYEKSLDRETLAKRFDLDLNKKWILFAEARDWVLDDINLKIRIGQGIDEKIEEESFKWNKKHLESLYKQFNSINEEFFDKFEIIYRPHPSCSNPKEIINTKVKVTSDYSIYEWLSNVDYYISSASTSAFEAETMNLPVVCFEIPNMPKIFKTYGLEEYYQINNLNDISEELFSKALEKVKGKSIASKYIGVSKGCNCENIADVIFSLIRNEKKINHDLSKIKNKNLAFKRLKFFIKKLLMVTGLVRLVKSKSWCDLAYKDCPFKKENKKMYGIK